MKKSLKILQLYPNEMNIYGDRGNILAITRRAKQHGFEVDVVTHEIGGAFATDADIIIGGGGQDSGQNKIQDDLLRIGDDLRKLASDNAPMLMICGLYQLFGHYFQTIGGAKIDGVGIFDMTTIASDKRLIGNVVVETSLGEVVGYENHSGLTKLNAGQKPFGKIIQGDGNNGVDKTEGAIFRNVIGSYLHGSLLPKNPAVIDFLIAKAAERKFGEFAPAKIDDSIAIRAHEIAKSRPR